MNKKGDRLPRENKQKPKITRVKKRDGRVVKFDLQKITDAIFKATVAIGMPNKQLAKDLSQRVVSSLEAKLKKDETPTVEQIQDFVETVLMESGQNKVAKEYILYRKERAVLREKKLLLGVNDDLKLSLNAIKVLKKRFLRKDKIGNIIETPGEMFRRVAKDIAQADLIYKEDVKKTEQEFYEVMVNLEFLPNSPTLRNAGRELQQLSGCYVLPIEDSLESIYKALELTALLHRGGAGTGTNFSKLRPKNDIVEVTGGKASGPVSFMKLFDYSTQVINEGSTRRGGIMGVLNVDHPDIFEFISAKIDFNELTNFNISVGITDSFMKAVKKGEDYNLTNPRDENLLAKASAKDVFNKIVNSAWKSGEPGLIFLDKVNKHNPTPALGKIDATNLCGEVPLLAYESCILGGINLAKMLKYTDSWTIDWDRIKQVVHIGVHFLDNLIDRNFYLVKEMEDISKANRKIGLGVMGFADILIKLKIPYNSDKAVKLAENVMKFILEEGRKASAELAKKRGVFPNYNKSIYKKNGIKLRNATITTIAPTGNRSIIADCSSGIEPLFALCYIRKNLLDLGEDELFEMNHEFEIEMKQRSLYSDNLMREVAAKGSIQDLKLPDDLKKIFVISHDISPEWHVKIQSAFQKYTDNAVSKTVNCPHNSTQEDIQKVFLQAYESDCKSITVYRYGSRDKQVLNIITGEDAPK